MRKEVRAGAITSELSALLREQKGKTSDAERALRQETESLRRQLSGRDEEIAKLEQRIMVECSCPSPSLSFSLSFSPSCSPCFSCAAC